MPTRASCTPRQAVAASEATAAAATPPRGRVNSSRVKDRKTAGDDSARGRRLTHSASGWRPTAPLRAQQHASRAWRVDGDGSDGDSRRTAASRAQQDLARVQRVEGGGSDGDGQRTAAAVTAAHSSTPCTLRSAWAAMPRGRQAARSSSGTTSNAQRAGDGATARAGRAATEPAAQYSTPTRTARGQVATATAGAQQQPQRHRTRRS